MTAVNCPAENVAAELIYSEGVHEARARQGRKPVLISEAP